MTYHSGNTQPKFILRNAHSGAKIIIVTQEGVDRLIAAMPSWKLAES